MNCIEIAARCLIYHVAWSSCDMATMKPQMAAYLKAIFDELAGIYDETLFVDAQVTAQLMMNDYYREMMHSAEPVPASISTPAVSDEVLAVFDDWFIDNCVNYRWSVETFVKSMSKAVRYLYAHPNRNDLYYVLKSILCAFSYRDGRMQFACFKGDFDILPELWTAVTEDEWRMFNCFDEEVK